MTPNGKKWIAPAALLALVLAALVAWNVVGRAPAAPAVDYPLLDGSALRSSDLRGKVVLVNFWATSCTTCVGEMPQMVDTFRQFAGKGFDLVAVSMSYDQPDYVKTFVAKGPAGALPFPVAFDAGGRIAKAFGSVSLTPTSFLIDRDGRIVKEYVGPPNFAELRTLIGKLLA